MENLIQLLDNVGNRYKEQGEEYLKNIESDPHFAEFKHAYRSLTIDDLKLNRDKSFFFNKEAHFTIMEIVNTEYYNMRIFFLAAGKSMPLHDHPGMMVLGNVLHGKGRSRLLNVLDTAKQQHFHKIIHEGKENEPANIEEMRDGVEVEDVGSEELAVGGGFSILPKDMKYLHNVEVTEDMMLMHAEIPNKGTCFFIYSEMEGGSVDGKVTKLRMDGKLPPFPEANFKYDDYKTK
jgi:hypothetical protein